MEFCFFPCWKTYNLKMKWPIVFIGCLRTTALYLFTASQSNLSHECVFVIGWLYFLSIGMPPVTGTLTLGALTPSEGSYDQSVNSPRLVRALFVGCRHPSWLVLKGQHPNLLVQGKVVGVSCMVVFRRRPTV